MGITETEDRNSQGYGSDVYVIPGIGQLQVFDASDSYFRIELTTEKESAVCEGYMCTGMGGC
jgi:hypothetical protein